MPRSIVRRMPGATASSAPEGRRAARTRPSSKPRPVGIGHRAAHRVFDLVARDADVPQFAVAELAEVLDGVAVGEMARDVSGPAEHNPDKPAESPRGRGLGEARKRN